MNLQRKLKHKYPTIICFVAMVMAVTGALMIGVGSIRVADAASPVDWFVEVNSVILGDGTALGNNEVIIQLSNASAIETTTSITWPNTFNGKTVVEIRGNTRTKVATSVTLPQDLRVIGINALNRMQITNITIPDSVTSIGNGAFAWSSLINITIPDSVTSIGNEAFLHNSNLASVTLGQGITSIGHTAFSGCSGLTSITIPDNVTSIGPYAFSGCTSLAQITLGTGITSIGANAFSNTSFINAFPNQLVYVNNYLLGWNGTMLQGQTVSVLQGTRVIADNAFANRIQLAAITFPNTLTHIGANAFLSCSGLTNLALPNNLQSIGTGAFMECSGLTNLLIPASVTNIGASAFANLRNVAFLTFNVANYTGTPFSGISSSHPFRNLGVNGAGVNVTFGNTVQVLPGNLFNHGTQSELPKIVGNITIPLGVTGIGVNAFRGQTGITSVSIPESVLTVGSNAFQGCTGLTTILIRRPQSQTTAWSSNWNGSSAHLIWLTVAIYFNPNGAVGIPYWVLVTRGENYALPNPSVSDIGFTYGTAHFWGWHTNPNAVGGFTTTLFNVQEDATFFAIITDHPPAEAQILNEAISNIGEFLTVHQPLINGNNNDNAYTADSWARLVARFGDLQTARLNAQQFVIGIDASIDQAQVNDVYNALQVARLAFEHAFASLVEIIPDPVNPGGGGNPEPVCETCKGTEVCTCPVDEPTRPNNMTIVHIGIAILASALVAGTSTVLAVAFVRKKEKKKA